MNFDYITDQTFRTILTRDFEELNKCVEAKASKSVLILSGSIIESILTDYFSNFPITGVDPAKVLKMDLATLLDLATEHKLIRQSTKELSTVIKNYRNLIHPGREIRKNEKFDYNSAIVAKSLLNIVLNEIKENYLNNLGYSATEILSKLENDSITQPIFEKILTKLHKSEKEKLYNHLIGYDLLEIDYDTQLNDPKKYISIIKSHVPREIVVAQLKKLVKKVETGEKHEVMSYFYLLYDDINLLDDSSIELILLYVLNALTAATFNENVTSRYVDKKLFAIFGKHLITEAIKTEFLDLACAIVMNHEKRDYVYFNAYDQLINSVEIDKKEKTKEYVLKNGSSLGEKFYKGYNDGDFIPF